MKTLLHVLFAVLGAAVPLSVAAELGGWPVSAALGPIAIFAWFAVSSVALVMATDYRELRPIRVAANQRPGGTRTPQADHPLAA